MKISVFSSYMPASYEREREREPILLQYFEEFKENNEIIPVIT